jgi:hypothetical protein
MFEPKCSPNQACPNSAFIGSCPAGCYSTNGAACDVLCKAGQLCPPCPPRPPQLICTSVVPSVVPSPTPPIPVDKQNQNTPPGQQGLIQQFEALIKLFQNWLAGLFTPPSPQPQKPPQYGTQPTQMPIQQTTPPLISLTPSVTNNSNASECLPPNTKLTDIVAAQLISFSAANGYTIKKVTVAQKLTELHASCAANGKLVDGAGKEIYFYQLTGCWGNPPFNYQDILAKQQQELQQLRQQYTVIEMTCNPSGIPPA